MIHKIKQHKKPLFLFLCLASLLTSCQVNFGHAITVPTVEIELANKHIQLETKGEKGKDVIKNNAFIVHQRNGIEELMSYQIENHDYSEPGLNNRGFLSFCDNTESTNAPNHQGKKKAPQIRDSRFEPYDWVKTELVDMKDQGLDYVGGFVFMGTKARENWLNDGITRIDKHNKENTFSTSVYIYPKSDDTKRIYEYFLERIYNPRDWEGRKKICDDVGWSFGNKRIGWSNNPYDIFPKKGEDCTVDFSKTFVNLSDMFDTYLDKIKLISQDDHYSAYDFYLKTTNKTDIARDADLKRRGYTYNLKGELDTGTSTLYQDLSTAKQNSFLGWVFDVNNEVDGGKLYQKDGNIFELDRVSKDRVELANYIRSQKEQFTNIIQSCYNKYGCMPTNLIRSYLYTIETIIYNKYMEYITRGYDEAISYWRNELNKANGKIRDIKTDIRIEENKIRKGLSRCYQYVGAKYNAGSADFLQNTNFPLHYDMEKTNYNPSITTTYDSLIDYNYISGMATYTSEYNYKRGYYNNETINHEIDRYNNYKKALQQEISELTKLQQDFLNQKTIYQDETTKQHEIGDPIQEMGEFYTFLAQGEARAINNEYAKIRDLQRKISEVGKSYDEQIENVKATYKGAIDAVREQWFRNEITYSEYTRLRNEYEQERDQVIADIRKAKEEDQSLKDEIKGYQDEIDECYKSIDRHRESKYEYEDEAQVYYDRARPYLDKARRFENLRDIANRQAERCRSIINRDQILLTSHTQHILDIQNEAARWEYDIDYSAKSKIPNLKWQLSHPTYATYKSTVGTSWDHSDCAFNEKEMKKHLGWEERAKQCRAYLDEWTKRKNEYIKAFKFRDYLTRYREIWDTYTKTFRKEQTLNDMKTYQGVPGGVIKYPLHGINEPDIWEFGRNTFDLTKHILPGSYDNPLDELNKYSSCRVKATSKDEKGKTNIDKNNWIKRDNQAGDAVWLFPFGIQGDYLSNQDAFKTDQSILINGMRKFSEEFDKLCLVVQFDCDNIYDENGEKHPENIYLSVGSLHIVPIYATYKQDLDNNNYKIWELQNMLSNNDKIDGFEGIEH